MKKFVFIFGRHPELSLAEIQAVYSKNHVADFGTYGVLECEDFNCGNEIQRLGGTVKIGEIHKIPLTASAISQDLLQIYPQGKIIFGISNYKSSKFKAQISKPQLKIQKLGLEIKRKLQKLGKSVRFVTSRKEILSSVIVKKEKCTEFLLLDNDILARTCAVQEFEEYSFRDYGRPSRDPRSGMLPPKLAKIMLNLSQAKHDEVIFDPFCGSGTIIQEALLMGFKNVLGGDVSQIAIENTKRNLEWIAKNSKIKSQISKPQFKNLKILRCDARRISKFLPRADVCVTEPYLGPPLLGKETREQIKNIILKLNQLYISFFFELKKILKPGGVVVIVFPIFRKKNETFTLDIHKKIQSLGFQEISAQRLIYERPGQRVGRQIFIFKKGVV